MINGHGFFIQIRVTWHSPVNWLINALNLIHKNTARFILLYWQKDMKADHPNKQTKNHQKQTKKQKRKQNKTKKPIKNPKTKPPAGYKGEEVKTGRVKH